MHIRRTYVAAVSIAAILGMSACSTAGGPSSEKETVTFWQFSTSKPTIAAYEDAIEAFEEKYPDIRIDMQIVPWADQQQKITTALASGSLPDVSLLGNNVVAQYAAAGALAPLDDYMAQWSQEEGANVVDDLYDGDKSYYTYEGKIYGSPVADETRMVYYNKALFREAGLDPENPPSTWAEMQKTAEALKSTGKVPWAAPMSNQYITLQTFMSVYLSYGAQLFDDAGQCGLNTPEFKDALTYYTGIAKAGLTTTDAANQQMADFDNLFMAGDAGMHIQNPSLYAQLKAQNPDLVDEIGIAPIPAGPKGRFGFLGGWPLVMWKTTDVPDAAAKWIHFVTSPDGQLLEVAKTSGILPGRKSLADSAPWNEAPLNGFAEQLNEAHPYQYPAGPSPKMGIIETSSIQTAVQQVATGALSVDDATSALCADINAILAK